MILLKAGEVLPQVRSEQASAAAGSQDANMSDSERLTVALSDNTGRGADLVDMWEACTDTDTSADPIMFLTRTQRALWAALEMTPRSVDIARHIAAVSTVIANRVRS